MEWKMAVAAALVVAAAACGSPLTMQQYRRLHEDTWRVPKAVCAHAAVAVHDAAQASGHRTAVLVFGLRDDKRYKRHATPAVEVDGHWHAVESLQSFASRRWVGHSRRVRSLAELQDAAKMRRFSRRLVITEFEGLASDSELARWRKELERFRGR
jgi:hypothetical protein